MCDHEMFAGKQVENFLRADCPLFINVSNHPSSKWSKEQLDAAKTYATDDSTAMIVDVQFPNVPAEATKDDVIQMAWDVIAELEKLPRKYDGPITIMVQGEMTLTFQIVNLLQSYDTWVDGVVAAVSERVVTETLQDDGSTKKVATFAFKGFRRYY